MLVVFLLLRAVVVYKTGNNIGFEAQIYSIYGWMDVFIRQVCVYMYIHRGKYIYVCV